MPKTYKIYTLGCKVNQYDSSDLARKLSAGGWETCQADADLAIINTCAVTKSAITKDKSMIVKARKENPSAKIAVVGCLPVNYRTDVEALGVDFIFGVGEFDKLVEQIRNSNIEIRNKSKIQNQKSKIVNDKVNCEINFEEYKTNKSRYFLKIQDGCQQFCSYCIIPYNRGKLKSRPAEEVIEEVEKVVALGYREIILCGIHLGLYGVDFERGTRNVERVTNLVSLLRELIKIDNLERIRLSSIEVIDVNDELIELMAKENKLCRHLHIPLQAGCDKILKLMNRPYTTDYFAGKVQKLRSVMPEICLTTDVIVGFPHETETDFEATHDFISEINFSKLHVFPFSAHEKTPAFTMDNQISKSAITARAKKLNQLNRKLEDEFKQKFLGQTLKVIVDGRSKNGIYRGKTEYFFDIEFESEKKYRVGELIEVKDWRLV